MGLFHCIVLIKFKLIVIKLHSKRKVIEKQIKSNKRQNYENLFTRKRKTIILKSQKKQKTKPRLFFFNYTGMGNFHVLNDFISIDL